MPTPGHAQASPHPDIGPQRLLDWSSFWIASKKPESSLCCSAQSASKVAPLHPYIELIGAIAAVITTIGWFPQVFKIARDRKADNISLIATTSIAGGVLLWTLYGLLIGSWPVIMANAVTFLLIASIVGMKLRYG